MIGSYTGMLWKSAGLKAAGLFNTARRKLMKRLLALVVPLALIAASATAKTVSFTFKNSTDTKVTEFYLSAPSVGNWEENLVTSPVNPGESIKSKITQTDTCVFDVRTVFADGEETEDRAWNFCENPDYDIEQD